ncbi:MAG: integrase arm-type DNA-binding domain-containing protein [Deltaproteobacteria bacterium]|nr:integrase arm-type DNA-binding domain-containing protein [Deltaproteobacteria bacterium]
MPLTDKEIKSLKVKDDKVQKGQKAQRFSDSNGLYLYVTLSGQKSWRFNFRFAGKQHTVTFGTYPLVSLKEARDKLVDAKRAIKAGINPAAQKQALKEAKQAATLNTFDVVAREWFERKKIGKVDSYSCRIWGRVDKELLPFLKTRDIAEITAPELLETLRKVEDRGAVDTAHRCLQYCGQIFRYAISTGRMTHDISADLKGALKPAIHSHMASLTEPDDIGGLLRAIDSYTGNLIVKAALKMAPYVFVRPGELRHAEWSEINFEKAEWRIPAEKMKMRQIYIVPLATQVIDILEGLHPYTGHGRFLFPSMRTNVRPISDVTLLAAIRTLGFSKDQMTIHGFRSIASTMLNELGFNRDWIERQLAHGEHNSVRAAHNYAEYLPERRKMMQSWADYLDSLRYKSVLK